MENLFLTPQQRQSARDGNNYEDFLHSKLELSQEQGIVTEEIECHSFLKPHQRDIVQWAVKLGRAAIFASFGLGKTLIQLEIARIITQREGGRFLIVAPLGVKQEFMRDAQKIGVPLTFVRRLTECAETGIYITNYETVRDGKLDPTSFIGASLDEAAILRGFGGVKTFRTFMALFAGDDRSGNFTAGVKYRFVATATPSPNEYIELLAYAAYLGIIDVGQGKTRWFKRDATKADKLTLHKHKEREWWIWVSSWAIFLQRPSDLGYSDEGYSLPEMEVRWHELPSDHTTAIPERHGQGRLFKQVAINIQDAAKEKRESITPRLEKLLEVVYNKILLSKYNTIEGDNGKNERRDTRIQHQVLPGTQREPAGQESGLLSHKQGTNQQGKEGSVSQEVVSGTWTPTQEKNTAATRNYQPEAQGEIRIRSRVQGETVGSCSPEVSSDDRNSEGEVSQDTLFADSRGVRRTSRAAGGSVRDMREWTEDPQDTTSLRGPLPQDETGSLSTMQQLQHGPGTIQGQSDFAQESSELPRQLVIWCELNDEQHLIEKALTSIGVSVASIYGNLPLEEKESRLLSWREKKQCVMLSKAVLLGSGVNLQQASHAIFFGIGFKFSAFIQAIHRIHRFLQKDRVRIDIIYTEAEREVRRILERKWQQHKELVSHMTEIIQEHGLARESLDRALQRSIGCERIEVSGERWKAINNDSVYEMKTMEDNSAHLILTSIPFSTQYEYTPCYDEETEVLTRRGWLFFGELTNEDQLATVNPTALNLEWQTPSEIIWRPYNGPMFHFEQRGVCDLMVTPEHKMFVTARVGNMDYTDKPQTYKCVTAQAISDNFTHRKWQMIATTQSNSEEYPQYIDIPQCEQRIMPRTRIIEKIKTEDFMRLVGWYLSEGCIRRVETVDKRGYLTISQSETHPDFRQEIIDLLTRIGLSPNDHHRTNIAVRNISLVQFLREQFGVGSYFLHIPRWIKDLHPDLLRILRDTMMKGDGNADGMAYVSYSKRLRDDFQEICLSTGWRASISGPVVRIGQKNTCPELRNPPQVHEYDGMIGCATVPNHTLVVRRNGKAIVSGNSYNDFGHNVGNGEFWQQMDFLTPHMVRILQPGRICAIHVKDRIIPGGLNGMGFQTVYPCHVDAILHYTKHGFSYMGMKTIVTDVVRENNQTYRLGWTEQCKDGTKMGVGMPEYLLIFRKPPSSTERSYADTPVMKEKGHYSRSRWQTDAHGFARSSGDRLIRPEELTTAAHDTIFQLFKEWSLHNVYDYEHHVKIGEGLELEGRLPVTFMLLQPQSWSDEVWTDVTRMLTLNGAQSAKGREMHLCPMQFDIADRCITQYTMPGELVVDPFGGLGSVPYRAVLMGRKGISIELNPRYWMDSIHYLKAAEQEVMTPSLFDFIKTESLQPIANEEEERPS